MKRGEGAVSKFGASAEASSKGGMKAFSLAGTLMGGAVVAAGLGLAALTKKAIDNAGVLHDLSLKTGIHVAALQAMTQVAEEASVSQETLVGGLKKMQVSLSGLAAGTQAQTEAFTKLGLTLSDLQGLSPDQQFAKIAEAMGAITDPTLRTTEAVAIFGKTGADLIPMMQGYGSAVAEAAQHQKDMGIAMSDTDTANLDNLGDSIGRLGDNAKGAATQFAITFGPAIMVAVEALTASMMGLNAMFKDLHDALETTREEAIQLNKDARMDEITAQAEGAAVALDGLTLAYQGLMDGKISNALQVQATEIATITEQLKAGTITADQYKARFTAAMQEIGKIIDLIGVLDGSDMSGAIAQMNGYRDAIAGALGKLMNLVNFGSSVSSDTGPGQDGMGGEAHGGRGDQPTWNPGLGNSPRPHGKPMDLGVSDSGGGGGGGGGGGLANSLANDLQTIRDSLQSQADAELAAYAAQQETLQAALDQKLLSLTEYHQLVEESQAAHQQTMAGIDVAAYGTGIQQMAGYLGVAANTLQAGGEKMQKVARVLGAAQALINAWVAYTDVLADKTVPFFAKFAAAGAVLAAGLGAVSAIKSGSSSSGGGGRGGGGGGSSGSTAQSQTPLQVRLTGFGPSELFSGSMLTSLFDKLNDEAKDRGYTILGAK